MLWLGLRQAGRLGGSFTSISWEVLGKSLPLSSRGFPSYTLYVKMEVLQSPCSWNILGCRKIILIISKKHELRFLFSVPESS